MSATIAPCGAIRGSASELRVPSRSSLLYFFSAAGAAAGAPPPLGPAAAAVARVPVEGARRRELAQLVTDHVLVMNTGTNLRVVHGEGGRGSSQSRRRFSDMVATVEIIRDWSV